MIVLNAVLGKRAIHLAASNFLSFGRIFGEYLNMGNIRNTGIGKPFTKCIKCPPKSLSCFTQFSLSLINYQSYNVLSSCALVIVILTVQKVLNLEAYFCCKEVEEGSQAILKHKECIIRVLFCGGSGMDA